MFNRYFQYIFFIIPLPLFYFFKIPFFSTNDDLAIALNFLTLSESPFINYFLNLFFFPLYSFANFPWYGFALFIIQISCLAITSKNLLKIRPNPVVYAVCLIFYILFCIQISYNNVAILASIALASIFLAEKKVSYKLFLLAVLGSLFRIELFILTYIFTTIIILPFLDRKIIYWIILGITPVLLTLSLEIHLLKTQSSQNFRDYQKFNKLRGQFHEFPLMTELEVTKGYEVVGWTESDFFVFKNWLFFNESLYNSDNLLSLKENTLSKRDSRFSFSSTNQLWENYYVRVIILLSILFILLMKNSKKMAFTQSIGIILYFFILVTFFRAPNRFVYPLSFSLLLLIVPNLTSKRLSLSLVLFLIFIPLSSIKSLRSSFKEAQNFRLFNNLLITPSEQNLIFDYYSTPTNSYALDNYIIYSKFVPYGWPIFSPRYYQNIQAKNFIDLQTKIQDKSLNLTFIVFNDHFSTMHFEKFLNQFFKKNISYNYSIERISDRYSFVHIKIQE